MNRNALGAAFVDIRFTFESQRQQNIAHDLDNLTALDHAVVTRLYRVHVYGSSHGLRQPPVRVPGLLDDPVDGMRKPLFIERHQMSIRKADPRRIVSKSNHDLPSCLISSINCSASRNCRYTEANRT